MDNGYFALQVTPNVAICEPVIGQFFMLKPGEAIDPLLLRPFSFVDFIISPNDKYPNGLLMFLIGAVGKGTNILKRLAVGNRLSVIGPLGRGFPAVEDDENLLVVAGGIGIASVLGLTKVYHGVSLFYGIRTKEQIPDTEWFKYTEGNYHIASDDGSIGEKGSVLELLERYISQLRKSYSGKIKIYACGPHGMYKAMVRMNLDAEVHVSLETPMACGIGTCLGCAVETVNGLKVVCKDGPVFNLKDIIWDG
ncbi:MAG: dihydroorotate dehydrogenase electron transfer subunit [Nitrospirae bacterium]|nr:dihydroorotate dehydrogenase electron transfer subunit [Nitrospirota bacterium]